MLTIEVGGLRVALEASTAVLFDPLKGRYALFQTEAPAEPTFRLSVEPSEVRSIASPDSTLRFEPTDATGRRYRFEGVGAHGALDFARGAGQARLDPRLAPIQLEYLLRAIYAYLALWEGGLLIHAAGLCYDAWAWLFIGLSGSGKTTVVRLSPGALALSDDLVVLRRSPDGWTAHSTPFWSAEELAHGQRHLVVPVSGIFRLVKAREVRVEPLAMPFAMAELVANCPVVNADRLQLPKLMATCGDLAAASPPRNLYFRKDPSFWDLLLAGPRRMNHES